MQYKQGRDIFLFFSVLFQNLAAEEKLASVLAQYGVVRHGDFVLRNG